MDDWLTDQRRDMALQVNRLRDKRIAGLPEWAEDMRASGDHCYAMPSNVAAHEFACRVRAWQLHATISKVANRAGVGIDAGRP
jgi:hypothetical protein